ncbi:MAG: methyltransferase family protein [Terriglobales bacterium]
MSWARVARRIRVPLGFAFAVFYLWRARPTWLFIAIGGTIVAAGLALRAVASGHISKNSELTTSGPYARTRNPLYLGSVIIAAGFVLAARSAWVALAAAVFFLAIYLPVIADEEKFLRSRFPEFEDYARQVPRFLPRATAAGAPTGAFSRKRYLQHREYNAVLGALLMMAALAAKLLWTPR